MAECTIQLSIDEFLKSYKTLLCKYNSYLDNPEVSLDDTNKIKDQIRELIEYYKDILLLEAYQDIEELDTLIASINQKLSNGEFVGVQGEPFLYEDFTPQQLEALKVKGDKGDSFTYDDFTPEQLANLKVYQNISQYGDNDSNIIVAGEITSYGEKEILNDGMMVRTYTVSLNLVDGQYSDIFYNSYPYDDILFEAYVMGYHSSNSRGVYTGSIGGYGLALNATNISNQYLSFSAVDVDTGRKKLRLTHNYASHSGIYKITMKIYGTAGIVVLNGNIT
jgi:hypothetical protein